METTVLIERVQVAPDVARVQIAGVVGEQVAAPHRGVYLAGAGGDAPGHAADQQRRDRQAQLVEQVVLDQQAEELRAALGEHAEQLAVGQDLQHGRAVDPVGMRPDASMTSATDPSLRRASATASAAGEDQRRHLGAGEELGVVVERRRCW